LAQPALDDDDDKPLDPAVERVRNKMVRFMLINLGILFFALIVVVGALVYKSYGGRKAAPADGKVAEATIALPAGAKVIGHDFADGQLSIEAELPDGGHTIFIYDLAAQAIVGRYRIATQ
jgi:hypothetical protein